MTDIINGFVFQLFGIYKFLYFLLLKLTLNTPLKYVKMKLNSVNVFMKQKNKEETKRFKIDRIKKSLSKCFLSTTCHGLPNIFKTQSLIIRIIWIICDLSSILYCIYLIYGNIKSYLSFEFMTNIDIIYEIPTNFPAISFCILNPLKPNLNNSITKYLNRFLVNLSYLNMPNLIQSDDDLAYYYTFMLRSLFISDYFTDKFRQDLGISLSDSLISCRFQLNTCTADDFEWFWDFFYGNCFKFNGNSSKILKSTQPGPMNSLQIELFIGNYYDINQLLSTNGVHVFINNQTCTVTRSNDGIDVPSGSHTNIMLDRTFNLKLENPYNDCKSNLNSIDSFDSLYFKEIIKSNRTYTQKDCFDLCLQDSLIYTCGCYSAQFNPLNSTKQCLNAIQVVCVIKQTKKFYNSDFSLNCSNYCPLECESINYSVRMSFADYPNPRYANEAVLNSPMKSQISNNTTYDILKKSMVSINVFYSDLKYTSVSQIPKLSLEDLISNIGGILGLFIGISFLSFIEIIEMILVILFIIFEKKPNGISNK